MIIHLLYYHTIARLNSEALAALFLDNRLIIINISCVLEIHAIEELERLLIFMNK